MKTNYFAYGSIGLGILSFFSRQIGPLFLKAERTSNTLLEAVSGQAAVMKKALSLQIGVGVLAVVLGILGLSSYNKNHEIKGKTASIIGIVIGVLSSGFAFLVGSLASSSSMTNIMR